MSDATSPSFSSLEFNSDQMDQSADTLKGLLPDAGELVGGASKGPIGFTGAVASIIKGHVLGDLADQDKAMDQLAEVLATPLGAGIADYNKHVHDAKQAVADLQSALAHAGTDTDPIGTQFKMFRAFADVFIEGAKKEVEAQGRREEATLLRQNATPQQIITARQQTRAKITWLDERKSFFDGSGLLTMEQAVRQQAKTRLDADSKAAVLAQQQAAAKNEDQQKQIQQLKNETGQGDLRDKDPAYIEDQKQIADLRADLDQAEADKQHAIEEAGRSGATPEELQAIIKYHDEQLISKAQKEFEKLRKDFEKKPGLLAQLEREEDEFVRQQAEATAYENQKVQEAKNNQARLDQLPGEIAYARFLEQMQRTFDAQVEATDTQTDQILATPPPANPDQGGLSFTPDLNPSARILPLNFPGGTGAAGGRRLDPERLNDILAGLMLEQDALKKSLAESQKKQAQMEREIQDLQQGQKRHDGQIRSANFNRF
jgi:hypothetical protein